VGAGAGAESGDGSGGLEYALLSAWLDAFRRWNFLVGARMKQAFALQA